MDNDVAANEQEPSGANIAGINLNVPIGHALVLESLAPSRKWPVHLLGLLDNKTVMVSAPLRDGKEVYLEKGSAVIVRYMDGERACAFESHVVYRAVQPFSYYHLAFPYEIETTRIRNAERVATQLDAWVDSDFIVLEDWPKPASITDISRSGARIESDELLGQTGHELIMDFRLQVSGLNRHVKVAGVIRNIASPNYRLPSQRFAMGLEFCELSDDARLSLANYIHEHH